jgi:hypothetical protein
LYVESNFLLEIALGQEESRAAEALLASVEAQRFALAIPSFSLVEPTIRIGRGIRDRRRLIRQLTDHVDQLARSSIHQQEVDALRDVPGLVRIIDNREYDRLTKTMDRLLGCARLIELNRATFADALNFRVRFEIEIEDAIVLAVVIADARRLPSPRRHVFANRNRKDFRNPGIVAELASAGCDLVWTFSEAARHLGVQ